ncbi:unnamed protein product [Mytilus coruscus]|uniref:VWFD domain-containing protein n=1 Tax=Mytilus coruscus TaxID=42192 RepID=A0A6J8C5Y4_MYTCO|nr:unnamed protein product [Mytilus coruscus]
MDYYVFTKMSNAFLLSFYGMIAITLGFSCDETDDHCFTSIDIRYALTMNENQAGQVYAKNGKLYSQETNVPVPIDNVITADGWNLTRILITANGTMPGPTIFLYQNQTITILVNNLLINETVTIHWHGIDQLAHPAMDGVAYLSQCPILPGHSFNYTFKPRFGGSYWYHSHVGIQRDMGLYGAFIVLRKRAFKQASTNHIIQIQEWNHLYDAVTLYLDDKVNDTPHSILINGRGQFKDILAPIETFNVMKGNHYLFRLIGVGSHRTLLFSIPGLKLTVFETDGFEIVPSVVDKIIIFPAERYDFELNLSSAEEKIYNITVSVLSSPNLTIGHDIGLGFLNVTNENSHSTVIENLGTTFLVLNCPFRTYPLREDLICIPLTDLKPQKNVEDDSLDKGYIKKTNETSLHFLNFGFPGGISSINGHSFRWPTVASLPQPSETNTNCNECDDEKTCKCSYSLNLKSGSEVIMVLSTLGQGATISHPIHMHGHTFEVLKMVFPEVTDDFNFVFTNDIKCSETLSNSQSQCNNAKWRNASWNNYKNIPGINLNDPIRKDTIVVPYGGYIIIRINATNPGVWFLHCHIDKHMAEGMAVMLNESFEHQHIYIPKGFPTCHSYLKTPSGVINEVEEINGPCRTAQNIDDWQRSVAFGTDTTMICDNFLAEGWYRVISGAGELMPTQCPVGGFRCNTAKPIYLYVDDLPVGEKAYPAVGVTVNRTAYAANYDGNCKHTEYEIQIKNCDGYYVYFLKSITGGCTSAYCFGDQLPCENGKTSENGFSPGCDTYPNVTVSPFVKATLTETVAVNKYNKSMVYSRATFECHANDLTDGYKYKTRWYINDIEMKDATLEGLSKTDVEAGLGRMLEEHWTSTYKPNMLVKCAVQVGGNGFGTYGPQHNSEFFFAGLKIDQSSTTDFQVLEGEELNIPAELTMPLSCAWPKNESQNKIDNIRQNNCILVLLNGVPDYQLNDKKCKNGITQDGVIFKSETCGIKFSHSNWQKKQMIKIMGQTDQLINVRDRIVFLRLYNSDEVTPLEEIIYWKNIHLPDIKVYVKDADVVTLGRSCYSHNDPHMRTFDQKTYELQIHQGLTEGEYIMYKHDRLPLQVSAYFKGCSTSILCNCGIAVRSGDSIFVANYCETNYKGQRKTNRYMSQRLCDDQSLTVTKTGNTYVITLPTGTKVTFNYGSNYVDGINIIPSVLDTGMTKGLCGIYNGNSNDDFMPRDQLAAVTDIKMFASSWQVKGAYADETLFDPNGKLKETVYNGQQYCTCVSPDNNYPHGSPEFNCELTSAMQQCRDTKTTIGVYTADCSTLAARKKRSTSNYEKDDEEPPSYPMISDDKPPVTILEEWQNGWTEASAGEHCTYHFEKAPAFNVCSEYVPYVNKIPFINGCIKDIKSTGGDSWLKVTIKNFASLCLQESKRLEILTVTNSTNSTGADKPIASIIRESICPEDCSNNGLCIDEECQCNDGYYGESCSLTTSQAPTIIKNAFEDLCDSSKKPCRTFIIPGSDFIGGASLTCKYIAMSLKSNGTTTLLEEGDTFTHPGTYASSLFMYCKLPGSRKKRSANFDIVATGYRISVSNNGENYTDPLTCIVFNSTCYECNTTAMSCEQLETCLIKAENPTEESETNIVIIVSVVPTVVIILIVIAVLIFKWKRQPKQSYITNPTDSLSNQSRLTAPKSHFQASETYF